MKIADGIYQVGGDGYTAPRDAAVYVLACGGQAALVDAGCGGQFNRLMANVRGCGVDPDHITHLLITHCHYDHTGGAAELKQRLGLTIVAHDLDAAYIEAGENDNLIVQKLEANPDALGIFGFSFLDQNSDKVQGSKIDGVEPEFELIAEGEYPVSRPLYFYVKKAHVGVIPGIAEFLAEFTSDKAWGEEGYLTDKGLIPMPDDERKDWSNSANGLVPLSM